MKILKSILIISCVLVNYFFLCAEDMMSLKTVLLCIVMLLSSSILHTVVHECGHLVGGLISRYKLVHIQFGPIDIVSYHNNHISMFWRKTYESQCIMVPCKQNPIRYVLYNLGGVLANFSLTAISIIFLVVSSRYITLISIQILLIGIIKIATNILPHINKSIPNDGYVLRLLYRNPTSQQDYHAYLLLYASVFWNEKINPSQYIYQKDSSNENDEAFFYNATQELLSIVSPAEINK